MQKTIGLWAAGALTSLALFGLACSGGETSKLGEGGSDGNGTGATSGQGGATGNTNNSSVNVGVGGFTTGAGGATGSGGSCVDIEFEATSIIAPADIVVVIDNSGSMSQEIDSVEQNVNVNFAQILGASMLDYQVIMVTNHGTGYTDVCIGPPLSGTSDCNGPPIEVPNQFYHYDVDVQSTDALCTILDTLYGAAAGGRAVEGGSDPNGIYTNGWASFLRPNALKVFLTITDDHANCSCPGFYCNSPALNGLSFSDGNDTSQNAQTSQAAAVAVEWDQALLGLAPAQFGSVADRNYIFHSIIGVASKPMPNAPYEPFEPIVATDCPQAVNTGPAYQWLAKGTQGLRFPECNTTSYDSVFQEIAAGVVEGAEIPCEFEIPDPGNGQTLDLSTLLVEYTPGDNSAPEIFDNVGSAAACGQSEKGFYIEDDIIKLCPETCAKVTGDLNAGIDIIAQCGGIAQ